MKYLEWVKQNINLISFLTGLACVLAGKDDVGRLIMASGGAL